jgi:hypothetical protein
MDEVDVDLTRRSGMMVWTDVLKGDSLSWLLESGNPTVRHLALRDLLDAPLDDADYLKARREAHAVKPIRHILEVMEPEGWWQKPGPGYGPKYRSTVWAITLLAQLGAFTVEDVRIQTACDYLVEHALAEGGQFAYNGAASGTFDCLQGNLTLSLLRMGFQHPRLQSAVEWTARSVTGEGIAPATDKKAIPRYTAYKCGPNFACGANNKKPCGWGAVKVLLALAEVPPAQRSPLMQRAVEQGVAFLFSVDPASAAYPTAEDTPPNRSWWKFGFPVFYITDILQLAEGLAALGYGKDPRLANLMNLILEKQDANGRWMMEYDYTGKTWLSYGKKGEQNEYVTYRALRVLKLSHDRG